MAEEGNTEEKKKGFRTGMWINKTKKGANCYTGATPTRRVYYHPNSDPSKSENDKDGSLVFYPKDKEDASQETFTVWLYKKSYVDKKSGETIGYLSGNNGGKSFAIFPNKKGDNPKRPDFNLLIDDKVEKPMKYADAIDNRSEVNSLPDEGVEAASPPPADYEKIDTEDDVPF